MPIKGVDFNILSGVDFTDVVTSDGQFINGIIDAGTVDDQYRIDFVREHLDRSCSSRDALGNHRGVGTPGMPFLAAKSI